MGCNFESCNKYFKIWQVSQTVTVEMKIVAPLLQETAYGEIHHVHEN